jgi:glycine amidinotransferase
MILPLKPGVFLVRHAGVRDKLPEVFRSWKFIVGPDPDLAQFPTYSDLDVMLSSAYIDLNVLSIDEERVLVNRDMPALAKVLEQEGFTPIPVRHRHRRLFGGGLHCFTLDTVRDGGPEDYLG